MTNPWFNFGVFRANLSLTLNGSLNAFSNFGSFCALLNFGIMRFKKPVPKWYFMLLQFCQKCFTGELSQGFCELMVKMWYVSS